MRPAVHAKSAVFVRPARAGLAALLLALASAAWGQGAMDAKVLAVEFDPERFVPGDEVSAYLALDSGGLSWQAETIGSGFQESGDSSPTVLSASLRAKAGSPVLVVRFMAWVPGPGSLPPLAIGGLSVPAVGFECGSALEGGDRTPPAPLPQLDPPGLAFKAYAAAAIALGLGALAFVVFARLLPWLRAALARLAFQRARSDLDAALAALEAGGDRGPGAWAALTAALRRYLSERSGRDWLSLTSGEARALPPDSLPGGVCPAAADILGLGDGARFAGLSGLELGSALARSRALADRLDEAALAALAAGAPGAGAVGGAGAAVDATGVSASVATTATSSVASTNRTVP